MLFDVNLGSPFNLLWQWQTEGIDQQIVNHNFMEMADAVSRSINLLELTETSLRGIPHWSLPEVMHGLKQCQELNPFSTSSGIFDQVLDSLIGRITAVTDSSQPGSSPESPAVRLSFDTTTTMSAVKGSHRAWWFEDLVTLSPELIEKIIKSMICQKVDHALISRFLMHYLKNGAFNAPSDKGKAAQAVIDCLHSLDGSSVTCKVLLDVLRISASLKLTKCCQIKLEGMIGDRFDQATVDNLLVPGQAGLDCLYDVNLILRLLKFFLSSKSRSSATQLKRAARLMDSYLAEVAPDSSLTPLKFLALATALPDEARDSHDAIYRAIDMYLEVHSQLSVEDKTRLVCAVNYEKLSCDCCKHLACNERFPSRTALRALICQQSKLRSLVKESKHLSPAPPSKRNQRDKAQFSDGQPVILYAKKLSLPMGHKKLNSELKGLQWKVMELEKACRKMMTQKASKSRVATRSYGSRSLPRLCS